jgi:hypothetical protein
MSDILLLYSFDAPDIHQIRIRYPNGRWKDRKNAYTVRRRMTTGDRKLTVFQTEKPLVNAPNITMAERDILRESDNVTIATYQTYGLITKRNREVKVIGTKKSTNPECNPYIDEDRTHFCLEYCNVSIQNFDAYELLHVLYRPVKATE